MSDGFDPYRDIAQQAVTAAFYGDREAVLEIVGSADDRLVLSLVLVDFAAYIHHRWCNATGVPRADSWAELMADTEEWRVGL